MYEKRSLEATGIVEKIRENRPRRLDMLRENDNGEILK